MSYSICLHACKICVVFVVELNLKVTPVNYKPFANLRKKNVEFIWLEKQQNNFDRLKVIMAKKPVVKVFDPEKDITLMLWEPYPSHHNGLF